MDAFTIHLIETCSQEPDLDPVSVKRIFYRNRALMFALQELGYEAPYPEPFETEVEYIENLPKSIPVSDLSSSESIYKVGPLTVWWDSACYASASGLPFSVHAEMQNAWVRVNPDEIPA